MVRLNSVHAKIRSNMSRDSGSAAIVSDIEARIQILVGELDRRLYADEAPMSAGALQVLEQSLHCQTRELADLITAVQVQEALDSDGLKEEARQFAGLQPGRLKNQGYRSVNVRFIGGTVIALKGLVAIGKPYWLILSQNWDHRPLL
jgi:hypothetical protein